MAENKVEVGQQCELRIWQERPKKDGSMGTFLKDSLDNPNVDEEQAFAVVVKQFFDEKNVFVRTELQINSPHLLKAFRDVVKTYPTVPSDFEAPFEMVSPFQMLFHYWDDLDVYRLSVDDDVIRMHVNLLFKVMESELGRDRARCNAMLRKNQVSFASLWTIYRPGELQYHVENGHEWLLRLEKTAYEESFSGGKYLEIHCSYVDFDGTDAGLAAHVFRIPQKRYFAAENPATINQLPVYPRKHLECDSSLEDRLRARGTRFLKMKGVEVKKYDGLALRLKEPPADYYDPDMADSRGVWLPYTETGRIVLDRKTFQEENHLEQVSIHVPSSADDDQGPTPLLCPPFAYGYSLARKDWCRFYVDNIKDVSWTHNTFDDLILGDRQKHVLRALVSSHSFPANARDQVQQKGKGLVLLLHGTPGSGKTFTAECAAEITEKALFSTTLGELDKYNYPAYFEYNLKNVLHYATTWKAIVLLDEADVFLEARQDAPGNAAERNALVAVFLKHLEYFSGIVFLTSNRVNVFDAAMKSRIHLAIEYSPPELEMRRKIWTQCLKAVPDDEHELDVEEVTDYFIRDKLNGREISNAVNTAKTLARFEKKPLEQGHIETVLAVRREFDASISRKLKATTLSESSHGSSPAPNRQNSLLMFAQEPSK